MLQEEEMANVVRGLYIGSADAAQDINLLKRKRIKTVLNVCGYDITDHKAPIKRYKELGIHYDEIDDWQDEAIEDDVLTKDEFFYFVARGAQFIRKAFEEKRTPILVHCLAGQNRSASVIVGYLSCFTKKKKSIAEVIEVVETANRKRNAYTLTQSSYKEALPEFPTWLTESNIL